MKKEVGGEEDCLVPISLRHKWLFQVNLRYYFYNLKEELSGLWESSILSVVLLRWLWPFLFNGGSRRSWPTSICFHFSYFFFFKFYFTSSRGSRKQWTREPGRFSTPTGARATRFNCVISYKHIVIWCHKEWAERWYLVLLCCSGHVLFFRSVSSSTSHLSTIQFNRASLWFSTWHVCGFIPIIFFIVLLLVCDPSISFISSIKFKDLVFDMFLFLSLFSCLVVILTFLTGSVNDSNSRFLWIYNFAIESK